MLFVMYCSGNCFLVHSLWNSGHVFVLYCSGNCFLVHSLWNGGHAFCPVLFW